MGGRELLEGMMGRLDAVGKCGEKTREKACVFWRNMINKKYKG